MSGEFGPIPMRIGTREECEACDYVVCATADTPTPFADNIRATCAMCQADIIHRPYAPVKPMKICIGCALAMAKQGTH